MPYLLLSLAGLACLALSARAADFPDPDKLPAQKGLPDPLILRDGARVKSAADWAAKRRPELKALIQHYMYGPLPKSPAKVQAKVLHEDAKAFGGKATLREVALTVAPAPAPKIHVLVVIPNKRTGPAPAFAGLNFSGNHTLVDDPNVRVPSAWMYPRYPGVKGNQATAAGRGKAKDVWALEQAIDRGYAVATAYNGDIDPDRKDERGDLARVIDPDDKSGRIALWAWGVHRLVDYLTSLDSIDPKRLIAVGHSRLGKTALLAAAFDDRIALAIPHQAGCGGTAPSRGTVGESVTRINTSFPRWFNAEFKKFNDRPERLPFDQHSLTALVAPRPVLFSNAQEDTWANPDGQFEVLKAAEPVYKLLKAGGLESPEKPKLGALSAGTLGYYIRAGKHSMTKEDWKVFLDFADKHLKARAKEKKTSSRARKVLLIGQGPDGHPFATHEYVPGLKVLAASLKNVEGLELIHARADGAWKEGPELLARADGAVLFLAEGARWASADPARLRALTDLAKRGGGLVTLHWAMGTRDAGPVEAFVGLFGACHGGPDRKYKVLTTDVKVADHPITRGLENFSIKDEFYYRLKLPKSAKAVTPLLKATIDGEDHMVAWAYDRPGGGRAFGFSGLHFHDNWKREEYRRLVAQGVLWSLGLDIPAAGLKAPLDLEALKLKPAPKRPRPSK